jgi:hypothetical protein
MPRYSIFNNLTLPSTPVKSRIPNHESPFKHISNYGEFSTTPRHTPSIDSDEVSYDDFPAGDSEYEDPESKKPKFKFPRYI